MQAKMKTEAARADKDAGAVPDFTNAPDNAFETEGNSYVIADESIKRSATW